MFATLGRGIAAGAAGTTALNAATYLDMALRARPASELPKQAVSTLAKNAGYEVSGEGPQRGNRLEGLAALSGLATGMGIGVAAALFGPILTRLPRSLAGVVLGAAAMAATDVPMQRLGLTDPAQWGAADWLSDALPHLAYGVATVSTLRALQSG